MRDREDMNKYNTSTVNISTERTEGEFSRTAGPTARAIGSMFWKSIKTVIFIGGVTGLLVFISVASFILSFRDIEPPNIGAMSLNYSSIIYINDANGNPVEYDRFHSTENRVWVDYEDLPQTMIDAIIAIEDKRFLEHNGVDWKTTANSVVKLATNTGNSGGGSTITQQLIKNVTDENQVSILRKVKEIFMALNLEDNYTKPEILEAYLNIVNFGGSARGVQAAANLYFDKDIADCDIAECASIAGITQHPYKYNPLTNSDANKEKQQLVIDEMHKQGKITDQEFAEAMAKSENMVFVGEKKNNASSDSEEASGVWNWYIETMYYDLIDDLCEVYGYSRDMASSLVYTSGLEIYCAMDPALQQGVEDLMKNPEILPYDEAIQFGTFVMDYNGRTLAVVGNRYEKTGNAVLNLATQSTRQTGSSLKPLSVFAPAIETETATYGTVLKDVKLPNYYGPGQPGPNNFSMTSRTTMNLDKAIEMSQNQPAAWLVEEMGAETSYNFLTQNLHFKSVDAERDIALSPMALGGLTNGATVREMTAGFQIFGNGGVYHKPYTYYYIKDHDGNYIVDNRDDPGEQAMSPENATVMNKLLHKPINGVEGTAASYLQIDGLDIWGKTGTTDAMKDLWFVGGTPFCVAGIWNGYSTPSVLYDQDTAKVMWRALILYLNEHLSSENSGYKLSENVSELYFCRSSGLIAGGSCFDTSPGWYSNNNIPRTCNGGSDHIAGSRSADPSTSPSASTSPDVSPSPSIDPSIPPESSMDSSNPDTSSTESIPPEPTQTPTPTQEPGPEPATPEPTVPPFEPSVPVTD